MAKLFKMTLYVCDLEDCLTLGEIKTLIDQNALSGVAVNCITHFADEQVGPSVKWHGDIDLNKTDATTDEWERYFRINGMGKRMARRLKERFPG